MYKIMIVEDDEIISKEISKRLKAWNYDIHCIADFRKVLDDFCEYQPQLVLLDISLPFFNGYHWCTEMRKVSSVPIIFLSSYADNMNIVMAMTMGADDFIAKPFDLDVLTAKISALLRRTYDMSAVSSLIKIGKCILNQSDMSLSNDNEKIELSKNEFRILSVLLENKGKVVTRDILMNKLWETDSFIDDNTLTVNINRLRTRLREMGLSELIKTKKGIGYMIEQGECQ